MRVEVCDDIFTAIEKGTKQPFGIMVVDWSSQPEAGFLVKRARESGPKSSLLRSQSSTAILRRRRCGSIGWSFWFIAGDGDGSAGRTRECDAEDASAALKRLVESESDKWPRKRLRSKLRLREQNAEQGQQRMTENSRLNGVRTNRTKGKMRATRSELVPRNYAAGSSAGIGSGARAGSWITALERARFDDRLREVSGGKGAVLKESLVAYFHLEQPDTMPVISARREEVADGTICDAFGERWIGSAEQSIAGGGKRAGA